MRALLGLLLLGTLFVMAASWQNRTTKGRHDERARRFNMSDATFDEDWSRLLVGRPSGGEPIPVPEDYAPAPNVLGDPLPPEVGDDPGWTPTPPPAPTRIPPDRVYVVKSGEVLGSICQREYEVRPLHLVVDKVARYNDLASPDAIREGLELKLPDPAVLFPD